MGRRKSRSVSPSRALATKKQKPSSKQNPNPFLAVYGRDESGTQTVHVDGESDCGETDRIFDEMLLFTELSTTKPKSSSHNNNENENMDVVDDDDTKGALETRQSRMETTVRNLLNYMVETHTRRRNANNTTKIAKVFVSEEDIARLLLPWSVKAILQTAYRKKPSSSSTIEPSEIIHWKTLDGCLAFFFDRPEESDNNNNNNNTNLNNLLTLSTMHKIIPIALKLALANEGIPSDEEATKSVQIWAEGSYCRLVDHLYRPPFDVLCDALLPILAETARQGQPEKVPFIWLDVAISTIRLMNSRIAKANPKKSFQLLVRPKVFLDLAMVHHCTQNYEREDCSLQIQELIKLFDGLIRTGIFSLEHHMDGFRSLQLTVPTLDTVGQKQKKKPDASPTKTSKSNFRGYQEGLLQTLEDVFTPSNDNMGNDQDVVSFIDIQAAAFMSPLLLDIFLQQTSQIQEQQAGSKTFKKSKGADKLGHLQFRFFACLSGHLMNGLTSGFRGDNGDVRLSLVSKLGKNLELLLTHNIYQPSLGNNVERSFLESVGKTTIRSIATQQDVNGQHLTRDEWNKSLVVLDVLIRLNHTVLHDQLAEVLARCTTHDAQNNMDKAVIPISSEASTFLATIIETYGKLRQLDYFYQSLFEAVSVLAGQNDLSRLGQLLAFAGDNTVSSHLGRAVQESPIQQLKQIFSNMNDSISNQSFSKGKTISEEVALLASCVFTKSLIGLIQNVRVDSNSSSEIYPICKDILNGSVFGLIGKEEDLSNTPSDSGRNLDNAVMLCSWTINLKNRCEFWIGNKQNGSSEEEHFNIPPAIRGVLDNAIGNSDEPTHDNQHLIESLKFLACQRIQQLHGECYEKQKLAYASDAKEYSTDSETREAQQLVSFILRGCSSDDGETESVDMSRDQWIVLAESISIWAPYASQSDVDSFLNLLLQSVALADQASEHNRDQMMSILNDASFYEVSNVSERLAINVTSFVAENVRKILSLSKASSPRHVAIACPLLHSDWTGVSFEELAKFSKKGSLIACPSRHRSEIEELLQGSFQVLHIMNNMSIPIWEDCDDRSKIFESLTRIESVYSMVKVTDNGLDTTARILSALRVAASRVLASIQLDSDDDIHDCVMLLRHTLENSVKIFENDLSYTTMHMYDRAGTMIIESLVCKCVDPSVALTMDMIEVLESLFDQDKIGNGGSDYLVLITYATVLLKKSLKKFGTTDTGNAAMKELLRVIEKRIWKAAKMYCFQPPKEENAYQQNQSMIFIAEVLRLSSTCSETQSIPVLSVEKEILRKLKHAVTNDSGILEMRSLSYLIGCFATTKPSRSIRQQMTSELLSINLAGHVIFLTPLCIFAREMEVNEFDELLIELTSDVAEIPGTSLKLRIMHMVLLSTTDDSRIELIAKHSSMIMNNCLQVMAQVAKEIEVDSDSIMQVSSLIIDMASKKDVMMLRERDIALILARITSALRIEAGDSEIEEVQMKSYEAMFLLVSFFLQRFSKQMHSCVPSLVISLNAMLQFTLNGSLHEDHIGFCGQKFSRLCELLLPHGDVYKKHVICLILRFVNALQGDMDSVCKKNLLPGIYCLLDIIQEHETMQLNSMLDEECRALLRSVHEGYKKIHVYKGQ